MQLRRYLERCYDILATRRDASIEVLVIDEVYPGASAAIKGRIRFWDDSLLEFIELLEVRGNLLRKVEYAYHYQASDNSLIFRYDDSPHHPEIPTHPHHKHVRSGAKAMIESASAPQLTAVLAEIEKYLYSER